MSKKMIVVLALLLASGACWAGEKEELGLQISLYQERLNRLQLEYALTQRQLQESQSQLSNLLKKEQAAQKEKKDDGKKEGVSKEKVGE